MSIATDTASLGSRVVNPGARILLELPYSHEIIMVEHWESITTTQSMNGVSQASISLNNTGDRFFPDSFRDPYKTDEEHAEEQSELNRIGRGYEALIKDELFNEETTEREFLENFLDPFYIRKDLNEERRKDQDIDVDAWKEQFRKGSSRCLFQPMSRIWIDMMGRDRIWYGVFTGIVTSYNDSWTEGGARPMLDIVASDARRWLTLSPLQTGFQFLLPEQKTPADELLESDPELLGTALTLQNLLGDLEKNSPSDIMSLVVRAVQYMFGVGEDIRKQRNEDPNSDLNTQPTFYREDFWKGSTGKQGFFNARPALREGDDGQLVQDDLSLLRYQSLTPSDTYDEDTFSANPLFTRVAKVIQESYRNPKSFQVGGVLTEKTPASAYRVLVREQFQLFEKQYEVGMEILNKIAQVVMGYSFVDGMGNLLLEVPLFNEEPDYSSPSYGIRDNSRHHGFNYVIGGESFISHTLSESEEPILTFASVKRGYPYILNSAFGTDGIIEASYLTGYAKASRKDFRRYGLRQHLGQTVFWNASPQGKQLIAPDILKLLYMYAEAIRVRNSAHARSARFTFLQRPDFQLNRTVVYPRREVVGLITEVVNTITAGGTHTTTLNCEYVRPIGKRIIQPWKIFSLLNAEDIDDVDFDVGSNPWVPETEQGDLA